MKWPHFTFHIFNCVWLFYAVTNLCASSINTPYRGTNQFCFVKSNKKKSFTILITSPAFQLSNTKDWCRVLMGYVFPSSRQTWKHSAVIFVYPFGQPVVLIHFWFRLVVHLLCLRAQLRKYYQLFETWRRGGVLGNEEPIKCWYGSGLLPLKLWDEHLMWLGAGLSKGPEINSQYKISF